jgi:hypothetical protein
MTHSVQFISLKPTTGTVAAWGMDCVNFVRFRGPEGIPGI